MKQPEDVHLSREEGDALIERLERNALSAEDRRLLVKRLTFYFWLLFALREAKLSLKRLKALVFGEKPKKATPPLSGGDTGGGSPGERETPIRASQEESLAAAAPTPEKKALSGHGEKLIGTPAYMAPEFIRNEPYDERVDLYAWAILFYAMVCGKAPFTDPEPLKILQQQLHETPPPLRKMKPEAPECLERLVMKALEKRPQRRQQNMDEVIAELERVKKEVNAAPVVQPPPRASERPVKFKPGRGLRLAGALGLAIIIWGKISTGAIAPKVVNEVAKVPETTLVEKPQKKEVQEMIVLTPKETKVAELIDIARSRIKFGKHRKAVEYLDKAKRLDPTNGEEHAVRRLAEQLSGVKPPLLRSRAHQTKRR